MAEPKSMMQQEDKTETVVTACRRKMVSTLHHFTLNIFSVSKLVEMADPDVHYSSTCHVNQRIMPYGTQKKPQSSINLKFLYHTLILKILEAKERLLLTSVGFRTGQ